MSKLRTILITAAVCVPVGFLAAGPLKGHPNMQAAQTALNTAWTKIEAAQKANEFDMEGHAQKAKEAIKLASDELKLAAEVANSKK